MNNKELIKLLTKDGACMSAVIASRSLTPPELLKLYIDNIDHCITSELLTGEFLGMNASDEDLIDAGIFINKTGNIIPRETMVLINCNVRMLISNYEVVRVYNRNSNLVLDVVEYGYAMVDLHENSRAVIHNHSSNQCSVNQYPGTTVENVGSVKINKKDTY